MLSINDAAKQGVGRLRKKVWAEPMDHIKIDILSGGVPGPWIHLYAPFNKECNGRDPVDVLCTMVDYNKAEFVPYDGPLPDSDEYRDAVAKYDGVLSR